MASEGVERETISSRGYDEEAMKLMPRRPAPPWWRKWMLLALFAASVAVVPLLVRLRG